MQYIIVFTVIVSAASILLILYFFEHKKKQLKKCDIKDFSCHLKKISGRKVSDKEKIIDYDKLYHKILLKSGYTGSFGDILKKSPKEIQNLETVWRLHKIRNLLVHEMGYPKGVDLEKSAHDYKKEVSKLLKVF